MTFPILSTIEKIIKALKSLYGVNCTLNGWPMGFETSAGTFAGFLVKMKDKIVRFNTPATGFLKLVSVDVLQDPEDKTPIASYKITAKCKEEDVLNLVLDILGIKPKNTEKEESYRKAVLRLLLIEEAEDDADNTDDDTTEEKPKGLKVNQIRGSRFDADHQRQAVTAWFSYSKNNNESMLLATHNEVPDYLSIYYMFLKDTGESWVTFPIFRQCAISLGKEVNARKLKRARGSYGNDGTMYAKGANGRYYPVGPVTGTATQLEFEQSAANEFDSDMEQATSGWHEIFEDLKSAIKVQLFGPKSTKHSLIIYGTPGTGKTTEVEKILKAMGFVLDKDFIYYKGEDFNPEKLGEALIKNRNVKIIVFDDSDRVINKQSGRNASLLKNALDSKEKRFITVKVKGKETEVPFKPKFIFLTNKDKSYIDPAIVDRSITVPIKMTPEETVDKILSTMSVKTIQKNFPAVTEDLMQKAGRFLIYAAEKGTAISYRKFLDLMSFINMNPTNDAWVSRAKRAFEIK